MPETPDRPATVTSLECGKPHPDLGWPCHRMRGHAGDHLGRDPFADTTLNKPLPHATWRDFRDCCDTYPNAEHLASCELMAEACPPEPPTEHTMRLEVPRLAPLPEPVLLEQVPDPHLERIHRACAALLVLAVLVALLCAPALVIATWRWALS